MDYDSSTKFQQIAQLSSSDLAERLNAAELKSLEEFSLWITDSGTSRSVLSFHVEYFERFLFNKLALINALLDPIHRYDPFATCHGVQEFQSALSSVLFISFHNQMSDGIVEHVDNVSIDSIGP